jgi:hypothetical protein
MSVGQESVLRPVLDDSVQNLCISHLEIDRYQRLVRWKAGSGAGSFLSASFELTIVSDVRAQLFAYRLSSTLGSPPVFVVVPMAVLAKMLTVGLPQLLSEWPYCFLAHC